MKATEDDSGGTGGGFSDAPPIRTFQFDPDGIGAVKNSVNLFRGTVAYPLQLLTLPGPGGLEVSLTALYEGRVQEQVATWNLEAPTGVLGLGWTYALEAVVIDTGGTGSSTDDRYDLLAGGSSNQLVRTGTTDDGAWTYQAAAFQFWRILYYRSDERWEITHEDGTTFVYGGLSAGGNALQWGVRWGNWIGSSALSANQSRFVTAWNLRRTRNSWGAAVEFDYDAVEQPVGAGGLAYTKASYPRRITDAYGRTVVFNYGQKTYQPGQVCEYQDPHKPIPDDTPDAYQSRYETQYLDSLAVHSAGGEALFSMQFAYDLFNAGSSGDPAHPYLWKRRLLSVRQENAEGASPPALEFAYFDADAPAPGSLKTITYPTGGTATYTYQSLALGATRDLAIQSPLPGQAVPRVWWAEDYVVVTWYDPVGGQLQIDAYSWIGQWVTWNGPGAINAQLVDGSLAVEAGQGFFVVTFQSSSGGQLQQQVMLFRSDPQQFGQWSQQSDLLSVAAGGGATSLAVGADFVVMFNASFVGVSPFQGWAWSWQQGSWVTPALPSLPLAANPLVALAAGPNYYIAASYDTSSSVCSFQIAYHDDQGQWQAGGPWSNNVSIWVPDPAQFLFLWRLGPAYAVATYPTAQPDGTNVPYELRLFQWDESFNPGNASNPVVVPASFPQQDAIFDTEAIDALVGNTLQLLRYNGSGVNDGWIPFQMGSSDPSSAYAFAFGRDVGAASVTSGGATSDLVAAFDPNQPSTAGWSVSGLASSSPSPTVANDYMTFGATVYYRGAAGTWNALPTPLDGDVNAASVQNRGPSYIVWENGQGNGATTSYALLRNGSIASQAPLGSTPQRVTVDKPSAGTALAGPIAFITYPAGQSFDQAPTLHLYRVVANGVQGVLADVPVTGVEIDDGYTGDQPFVQSYAYDTTAVVFDPDLDVAQYPTVTVVAGSSDPTHTPLGKTINYYSNGFSQSGGVFYPVGWIFNYGTLLNGMLLGSIGYDAAGNEVSRSISYWLVTTAGPSGQPIYGGYFRQVKSVTVSDGVTRTVENAYDPQSGLVSTSKTTSLLSGSTPKVFSKSFTYAAQVPAYRTAMSAAHVLTPVVVTETATDGAITGSNVTTWKNWTWDGGWQWAEFQTFALTAAGAAAFDFTPGASNPGWRQTSEVVSRARPFGAVTEAKDVSGVSTSALFSTNGVLQTARFVGGSLSGAEVAYAGFESYEGGGGWTVGKGATVLDGVGHTGTACLQMPAGSSGPAGTFASPATGSDTLLACWIKTDAGFGGDPGSAGWQVTVSYQGKALGAPIAVPFEDSGGAWSYVFAVLPLAELRAQNGLPAGAALSLSVTCANGKSTKGLLLDDALLAPLAGGAEVRAYDAPRQLVTAQLDASGALVRTLYDTFQQVAGTVGADENVIGVTTRYASRRGNAGSFNPLDPNAEVAIRPAAGGFYQNFTSGEPWQARWTASDPADWSVAGRMLVHAGTGAATLTLSTPAQFSRGGVRFRLKPGAPLTQPIGIRIGSAAAVQWNPSSAQWELQVGGKTVARAAPVLFRLPAVAALALEKSDVAAVAGHFRRAGHGLSASARIQPRGKGGWTVHDPGRRSYVVTSRDAGLDVAAVASEWLLFTGDRTLFFYADGQRVFSYVASAAIAGPLQLFLADPAAYGQIVVLFEPRVSVVLRDGTGRSKQQQLLESAVAVVNQTVFDGFGRAAVKTKPARIGPTAATPLLAYVPDFVSGMDWTSGVMTGLVSDAYPKDRGYPYARELYESSPRGRVIERGRPGADFAIDLRNSDRHTTRFTYGASDGAFGLPAGEYFARNTVDPQGSASLQFTDKTGAAIGQAVQSGAPSAQVAGGFAQSFNQYDDAGNLVAILEPNYFAPPPGSLAAQWQITTRFDFQGRPTVRTTPDGGSTTFLFDAAGRLRFQQDPDAAGKGLIVYRKYDPLGRTVETGSYAAAWDPKTLQALANDDPSWPPAVDSWRKRLYYDGDGSSPTSVGRLWRAVTNNAGTANPDVLEDFAYDVYGRLTEKGLMVTPFSNARVAVGYDHDNLGNVTRIVYPSMLGASVSEVVYGYDDLGRMVAVGGSAQQPQSFAAYAYNPDGTIATETLNAAGPVRLERHLGYNSPGWLASSQSQVAAGGSFQEDISYTSGGVGGAGFYNGQLASDAFQYQWAGAPQSYAYQFQYDDQGQLQTAQSTDASFDLGVGTPLSFDANSNILQVDRAGVLQPYAYQAGTNRLLQVTNPGGAAALTLGYDGDGYVTSAKSASRTLLFSYDVTTGTVTTVTGGTADLAFTYGAQQQRVLKQATAGGKTTSKLYVHGNESYPLVEVARAAGGALATTCYVPGAAGTISMVVGSTPYYLLKDHLGSTRVVVDAQGKVAAGYDYLPFGGTARAYGATGLCSYLFTGQELDSETGLYNFRARFYDPFVGRFYTPDPSQQYFSPYVYAANDPLLLVDPTGQLAWWQWLIIGIVIAVLVVVAVVVAVVTCGAAAPEEIAIGGELAGGLGESLATESTSLLPATSDVISGGSTLESGGLGLESGGLAVPDEISPVVSESGPTNLLRVVNTEGVDVGSDEVAKSQLELRSGEQGLSVFEERVDPSPARVVEGVETAGKRGTLQAVRFSVSDLRAQGFNIVKTEGQLPSAYDDVNAIHYELRSSTAPTGSQSVARFFNRTMVPKLLDLGTYL